MNRTTDSRWPARLVATAAALALLGLAVAVRVRSIPLGVPGEWTWLRIVAENRATALDWLIGFGVSLGYCGFVLLGDRSLTRRSEPGRIREAFWVLGLAMAAVAAQFGIQAAAPEGYGLEKWTIPLYSDASNGYYSIARDQIDDPWRFLRDYPTWIAEGDSLHIGTHPPGLLLAWRAVLGLTQASPELTRAINRLTPASVRAGFGVIDEEIRRGSDPMPQADRAALTMVGAGTLLACALTVLPLYGLARQGRSASDAWRSAALWPIAPAAVLFQPTADAAYPLLATLGLAWAATTGRVWKPLAGVVLGVGTQFSLVFFPVGLIAGIVAASSPRSSLRDRTFGVGLIGLGFLTITLGFWAITDANPFVIWAWNARNHARFYDQYPRGWLVWNLVNPPEVAVAIGLPAALMLVVGIRKAGRATWTTLAVLLILQLTGRNLGEVGRLWLPFYPALLAASGAGFREVGGSSKLFVWVVALSSLQVLLLQDAIQVVYAVTS